MRQSPQGPSLFTRAGTALAAAAIALPGCGRQARNPDVEAAGAQCTELTAENDKLKAEAAEAKKSVEACMAAGKQTQGDLDKCKVDLSAAQKIKEQEEAQEPEKTQQDNQEAKDKEKITKAVVDAGVKEENKVIITTILEKLFDVQRDKQRMDIGMDDPDFLRSFFGDNIKAELLPLMRNTTIVSVSNDFFQTVSRLPISDQIDIASAIKVGVVPAIEAATKFERYRLLFERRIFEVCPDELSVSEDSANCRPDLLVGEYHRQPDFDKMVYRLIWQLQAKGPAVMKLGITARDRANETIRVNGAGL